MQKNPFVILGVDEKTVTQNELFEVYKELRDKYSNCALPKGKKGRTLAESLTK